MLKLFNQGEKTASAVVGVSPTQEDLSVNSIRYVSPATWIFVDLTISPPF